MTTRARTAIILGILAMDQLSKQALKNADFVLLPGVLRLHGMRNEGAAFGLLGASPLLLLILSGAVMVALAAWLIKERPEGLLGLGLTLVLGGALGNYIDRLALGYVIDFVELLFVRFAVFNLADVAVTAGCGLCILGLLTEREGSRG